MGTSRNIGSLGINFIIISELIYNFCINKLQISFLKWDPKRYGWCALHKSIMCPQTFLHRIRVCKISKEIFHFLRGDEFVGWIFIEVFEMEIVQDITGK